jgi:hypothetical protein
VKGLRVGKVIKDENEVFVYKLELKNKITPDIMHILFWSEGFYEAKDRGREIAEENHPYGWVYWTVYPVHEEILMLLIGETITI